MVVAVCVLVASSVALGEESFAIRIKGINLAATKAKGNECLKVVDQYMELAEDEKLSAGDRLAALQACFQFVAGATRREKVEGLGEKAEEAFAFYRSKLAGSDPAIERGFVDSYVRAVLGRQLSVNKERAGEFIKIVDACEKALNSNKDDPCADLERGFLLTTAGSYEDALKAYERYLSASKTPSYYAFAEMAQCDLALKRAPEALAVIAAGMKALESNPPAVGRLAMLIPRALEAGDADVEKAVALLPGCVVNVTVCGRVMTAVAQRKLRDGQMGPALGYARLCYVTAPIEDSTAPMELVAKCLTATDMDPAKAAAFLDYQKYGTAGEDGKPGTADDCKDLLANVANPLPPAVIAALEAQLKTMVPGPSTVYATLRDRGVIYLALGKPLDALRSFRSAYDAASIAQVKEGSALVPRALKAVDGSVFRANAYLLYQKHGASGPDGKAGTPDDLTDPLAKLALPPLPAEVQAALRQITQDKTQTAVGYQQRGFAYLALGEYEKGFDQMRGAYVFAGQGASQAQAIEAIAAAIKAFDGNVMRANQYLLYQSHGANGPDKKAGTADDLVNVFPDVLKEIKKSETASKGG